jgi:hypothetical protein
MGETAFRGFRITMRGAFTMQWSAGTVASQAALELDLAMSGKETSLAAVREMTQALSEGTNCWVNPAVVASFQAISNLTAGGYSGTSTKPAAELAQVRTELQTLLSLPPSTAFDPTLLSKLKGFFINYSRALTVFEEDTAPSLPTGELL